MYGTRPTQLITGGFVGHEPDEFQNPSHRDHETNGLEVNAGQSWPPLEPPVVFRPPSFQSIRNPRTEKRNPCLDLWPLKSGGACSFFASFPPRSPSRCAEGLRVSPPRPLSGPRCRSLHAPPHADAVPLLPSNLPCPAWKRYPSWTRFDTIPNSTQQPTPRRPPTLRGSVQRRFIPHRCATRDKTLFVRLNNS